MQSFRQKVKEAVKAEAILLTLKMWMTEVPLRSTWIMRQVMIG